jgi:peroxiredoxin Q/BCP
VRGHPSPIGVTDHFISISKTLPINFAQQTFPDAMAPKRKSTDSKAAEAPKKAKAGSKKLVVGDNVGVCPVTLITNDEKKVTLPLLASQSKSGIVIFCYPRCATPGCTKQACGFRDNYEIYQEHGFDVYGMSFDKPKSQTSWAVKQNLPYQLLTDADGIALKAFGAFKLPKNVIRSHFIIAKDGTVLEIRNQISPADSFNEAVKFVKSHK